MDVLEYRGYVTKVHYDAQRRLLYGKVQGIIDAVNYESTTIDGVEAALHDAVDHYLAFCANVGRRPARAFKGQFNVRLKPALHKDIVLWAMHHNTTLNSAVEQAVQEFLARGESGEEPRPE